MKNQWEKFKHRTLTKVFLGYAVVAWIIIQIIEAVLPTFETPLWVAQTLTFLLILGFPIAILVGWASEKLPASATDSGQSTAPQLAHATPRRQLIWIGAASCIVVGLFGFYMMPFIFDESSFSAGVSVSPERGLPLNLKHKIIIENTGRLGNGLQAQVSISPNGRYIVYTHIRPSTFDIMLHDLTSFGAASQLVTITRSPINGFPKFSDDGQWIYYHDTNQILRIRREGGTPQVVVEGDAAAAGVATNNNEIIYRKISIGGLSLLDLGTGEEVYLSDKTNSGNNYDYTWPEFLPGASKIIATKGYRGIGESTVDIINLETGAISVIASNAFQGRYIKSGHIIFGRDDSVWAQPVDVDSFMPNGDSTPVIFDAETIPSLRLTSLDISEEGRLIYIVATDFLSDGVSRDLVAVDSAGQEQSLEIEASNNFLWPSKNPVGEQLALTVFDPNGPDIWVFDTNSKTFGRRSFSGDGMRSIWSSDGNELIFGCYDTSVCVTSSDGTSNQVELFSGLTQPTPLAHTKDGLLLLSHGTPRRIYKTDLASSSDDAEQSETSSVLTDLELAPADSGDGTLSSDEMWLAYASDETGRFEIYVRPFPEVTSGKWQVTRTGGRYPRWDSENGSIRWWDIEGGEIMSSDYRVNERRDGGLVISFDNPKSEFEAKSEYLVSNLTRSWDFDSSTGQSFFVRNNLSDDIIGSQIQFHITESFFDEVSAMAPPLNE